MPDLLQLSFRAVDLATRPARFAIGLALQWVRDDGEGETSQQPATGAAAPMPEPADTAPQTRPRPARPKPSPKRARRAVRHEPTKGQAAAIREAQREAEWAGGSGPGANVVIDEEVLRAARSTPDEP